MSMKIFKFGKKKISLKSQWSTCVWVKFSANLEDPSFGRIFQVKLSITHFEPKNKHQMLKFGKNFDFNEIAMVNLCLCEIFSQFGGPKFGWNL